MKKVTKKELENIQAQQGKLYTLNQNISSFEMQKAIALDNAKAALKEIEKTKSQLEKKYGSVNINLENGAITPIKNEQDNKKD